ncbi:MAG: glycolate oxidase subunit GlcD [Spirochaetes bacterium]|nr:MAG: glycolate oxidase subunit GlcD [Spirochaetota bacterium]
MDEKIIKELKEILGSDELFFEKEDLKPFSYDATERTYYPEIAVMPTKTEQVAGILKIANREKIPVTPQGGRTGLSGGALPIKGGIALSLLRMNRIIEIDLNNLIAIVEPGLNPVELQQEVNKVGLFYPPDPSSQVECTIGGNVAENAGYTRAVRYGVTKDWILGLEAVLPTGEIIHTGRKLYKDVAGYDLTHLIVGSEGTLAVVTKIILKLLPKPEENKTITVIFDDVDLCADMVVTIFQNKIIPTAIEFMDNVTISSINRYLGVNLPEDAKAFILIELDGTKESVEVEKNKLINIIKKAMPREISIAKDDKEREKLWRIRRDALPALTAQYPGRVEADVVVPRYSLPSLVKKIREIERKHNIKIATYGHAGDGNLHVTFLINRKVLSDLEKAFSSMDDIFKATLSMGGSITGEHGVGITISRYIKWQFSDSEIELMKRIKKAFDPNHILNPGKIFYDIEEAYIL